MYDTSPLAPFKGETKPLVHVGFDNKILESLFDLHPSLENSFDLTDFVANAVSGGNIVTSPPGVPDSAVVTSPVASSAADLLTLSSAATSQHLAEIERRQPAGTGATDGVSSSSGCGGGSGNGGGSSNSSHHHHHHHHHRQQQSSAGAHYVSQQMSPGPVGVPPSTPSPVSHHHHSHPHPHPHHQHQQPPQQHPHQPLQGGGYQQPVLSPSLTVDDVSQAFSDDSCVFMPEYEQLGTMPPSVSAGQSGSGCGPWSQQQQQQDRTPYYGTVKNEDMGLASLTACSLEASLPGFTSSTTTTSASTSSPSTSAGRKMEYGGGGGAEGMFSLGRGAHYSGAMEIVAVSPAHSMRTLSESSTATTSTIPPDSPCHSTGAASTSGTLGKGGSKRRQVPKGSEEYKEKRARNNVAVRKSRAKAKEKQRMTETRVKELTDQNDALQKRVEMLTKQVTVLRGLFASVGASLPDDLSKLLEQS